MRGLLIALILVLGLVVANGSARAAGQSFSAVTPSGELRTFDDMSVGVLSFEAQLVDGSFVAFNVTSSAAVNLLGFTSTDVFFQVAGLLAGEYEAFRFGLDTSSGGLVDAANGEIFPLIGSTLIFELSSPVFFSPVTPQALRLIKPFGAFDSNSAFVLNPTITLSPVPEPATYGMLIAGLFLVGFQTSRGKLMRSSGLRS